MEKRYLAPVLLGILLGLQGCGKEPVEEREIIAPVTVATVEFAKSSPNLVFPAVAAAADKSSLSFRLPGEITHIYVKPGDRVERGQLLARLDPTDYQLDVDDAQAKFNVADSQYRRSAKLVEQGFLAQSQFDELKAQRRIALARLNIAKLHLTFTELKAPISGVISRVPVDQFENVQVGQGIMNIHSVEMVDIQIQAPDLIYSQSSAVDLEKSRPGARVILSDGAEYRAFLKEYTTEPDPELGSFLVTLTMPMPKRHFILDGMTVEVRADGHKLNAYRVDEPVITLGAIFNEDGDELSLDNKFVWVVNDNNTVTKRKVVTGKVVIDGVRLLSDLEDGEVIVTKGGNRLRDGQKVKVVTREAE